MKRCGWFDFEPTKEKFPIRVDPYSGMFDIDLGENYDSKVFKGKDVEKLRGEAFIYLRAVTAGQWEPYIVVEHDASGFQHDHAIYFEYRRMFRLKKADGALLWKDWIGAAEEYKGEPGRSSHGPNTDDEYTSVKCLPYSKEAWDGLLAITAAVKAVDKKIKAMVASGGLEAKLKCIAAGTTNALGYSEPIPKKGKS